MIRHKKGITIGGSYATIDNAEKYPIKVLYNPQDQKKYNTPNSQKLIVWAWVQLMITVVMILHLFNINYFGYYLCSFLLWPLWG